MKTCGDVSEWDCPLDGEPCACFRLAGHSLNYDRPHGCICGALWA